MKLNFVTLFNSAYLSRGIVLYESLLEHCPDFQLYVVAFDDKTYEYLKSCNYQKLTPISLKEFEDPKLLNVKPTRSPAEYCWTSTPSTILYCIKKFQLDNCTYIDADMRFYSNPQVLIDEMGNNSVLITEHRYSKNHEQAVKSGKYCVQFIPVKNTEEGLKVINWWRDACIDWCYARHEDGKFGDQKYLDEWTTKFKGVYEMQHLGGGIAPWNISQYTFKMENNKIVGIEKNSGKKFDAVFVHYHGLKFYEEDMVVLTDPGYYLEKNHIDLFFKPYVRLLNKAKAEINKRDNSFNPNGSGGKAPYGEMGLSTILKYYFDALKSSKKNILGLHLPKKIKLHYFFKASKV